MMGKTIFLILFLATASFWTANSSDRQCSSSKGDSGDCLIPDKNDDGRQCLDSSGFRKLVSSFETDESVIKFLRGTADDILSREESEALLALIPKTEFVEASGYSKENQDETYAAPTGYSGLGLKELCCGSSSRTSAREREARYDKIIEIREKVRAATERGLRLCPGTLFVDFTTISQKTAGGAHRAHADNCLHYFRRAGQAASVTSLATCDPARAHPYPDRVAASILYLNGPQDGHFQGGEFFFANRTNGDVENAGPLPVEPGRMVYFTSGVENLHGALPVRHRQAQLSGATYVEPRRLALAMWYVLDPHLKEYVPPFQADVPKATPKRTINDPNDPNAPKELFSVALPGNVNLSELLVSMGSYLVSQQNKPTIKSWEVNMFNERTLHVLFKDHSAMFSLEFANFDQEISLIVERHTDGNKPASLQYLLQESVLLHGVLDELSESLSTLSSAPGSGWKLGAEEARKSLPARRV